MKDLYSKYCDLLSYTENRINELIEKSETDSQYVQAKCLDIRGTDYEELVSMNGDIYALDSNGHSTTWNLELIDPDWFLIYLDTFEE